tara:strand:+ start:303 stop:455 length:153 start_codon:yes stop_codon:yes gene_type:complete
MLFSSKTGPIFYLFFLRRDFGRRSIIDNALIIFIQMDKNKALLTKELFST